MKLRLILVLTLLLYTIFVTINPTQADSCVLVEFLYFEPCSTCPGWDIYYQVYEHNSVVIDNIERDYGSVIQVQRIHWASPDGIEKRKIYKLNPYDWNTIIINREIVLKGGDQFVDEIQLRRIIDHYLTHRNNVFVSDVVLNSRSILKGETLNVNVTVRSAESTFRLFRIALLFNSTIVEERVFEPPESGAEKTISFHVNTTEIHEGLYILMVRVTPFGSEVNDDYNVGIVEIKTQVDELLYSSIGHIFLAFVFGFLETFSPCLLILLSFLISYTLGDTASFKESLTKILIFGTGFLSAALLTGALAFFLFSLIPFQKIITLIVSLFAILFGLNVVKIDNARLFKKQQNTKAKIIVQKLAKRYSKVNFGMAIIGFLFYFLDPCIAPVFFTLIPLILSINFTTIMLAFCLGVLSPFLIIGVITGSLSRLVRFSYKHKSKLRLISGLILICYSIYLVFSILTA